MSRMETLSSPRSASGEGPVRWFALAGVVGPILFVVGFTVIGLLRPGYSPRSQPVSDLGVGRNAWAQNTNFVIFGVLLVAFAIGFFLAMRPVLGRARAATCGMLLALSGVGLVNGGVFTEDPSTVAVHWVGGFLLGFIPPIVAVFIVAASLRRDPVWRGYGRYSLLTGLGAVALIVLTFVFLNPALPLSKLDAGGLLQRVLVVEVFAWHAVSGWRLFRRAPGRAAATRPHGHPSTGTPR